MSLQSKILTHLRSLPNVWAVKVITANERGVPDILCCVRGRFLAIEVKEGKDTLSPIQAEQMDRIRWADGWAWKVSDFEKFKDDMTTLVKKLKEGEW